MFQNYKIWLQFHKNKSILDDDVSVFYLVLNDSIRRGLIKTFRILNIDDPFVGQRLQIQPVLSSLDPSIDLSLLTIHASLLPGSFYLQGPVYPLYLQIPDDYQSNYQYYALIQSLDYELYFLLALQNLDEVTGVLTMINWLQSSVFVHIEDNNGHLILTH